MDGSGLNERANEQTNKKFVELKMKKREAKKKQYSNHA